MKEVKILNYRIRGDYWKETPYESIRDDKAVSFREMTGFEQALLPWLAQGFAIAHVASDEDAEQFVLFLEREKPDGGA